MDDFGGIREIENIFPMIDILMGTYNGECYIEEQIESILAQTYSNWKLIIRDDGSTDRTFEIIRKYSQDYPDKIFVVDEDGNLGSCRNFASLMNLSSSDYVMFADQDDVWEKNKIELTFAKLLELEKIHGKNTPVLVHSDMTVVDKNLKVIAKSFWKMMKIFPEFESDVNKVAVRNVVTGMTIIMNRSALTVSIPIPDSAVMHDWWIAVNVAKRGVIGHITDKTVLYRQHGSNTIGCTQNPFYVSLNRQERVMEMLNDLPFSLDVDILESNNRYIYRKSFRIAQIKGIITTKLKKIKRRIFRIKKAVCRRSIKEIFYEKVSFKIDNISIIDREKVMFSGWCYFRRSPIDRIIIECRSETIIIPSSDFVFRDDVCDKDGKKTLSRSGFVVVLKSEDYYNKIITISFFSKERKLLEAFAGENYVSREVRNFRIDDLIRSKDGSVELSGWILPCRSRLTSIRAVIRKPERIILDKVELAVRDDVYFMGGIERDLVSGFRFKFNNYAYSDAEIEFIAEFENKGKFRYNRKIKIIESDGYDNFEDSLKLLDLSAEPMRKNNLPQIDVIIPVYNGYDYFDKLFTSIFSDDTSFLRLIIIDDASPDLRVLPYLKELEQKHSNILLLSNDTNLGFVKTVNKAFKLTRNHFIILNTDTEVPLNWVERLMSPILNNDNIASTTPFTNSGTICSFPHFVKDNPIYENMTVQQIDKFFAKSAVKAEDCEIPTGVGFCMGINKKAADEIGFFDEKSFVNGYCEENDWCRRAVKSGYKNVLVPNLFVYHKHGGSFTSEQKKNQIAHNEKILVEKHPEYFREVGKYCGRNPMAELRKILQVLISSSARKNVVILSHMIGGGADVYKEQMKSEFISEGINVIDIQYDVYKLRYKLSINLQNDFLCYHFSDFYDMKMICSLLKVNEIIINNLVTFPDVCKILKVLEELKSLQDVKVKTLIHDYFMICPSYVLLNKDGKFCGIPDIEDCRKCISKHSMAYMPVKWADIEDWRGAWFYLLNISDDIICFSKSSKQLLLKAYPELRRERISVNPHKVSFVKKANLVKNDKTLNIGILGTITYPKGLGIVEEMLKYIDDKRLKVSIKVIGTMPVKVKSSKLFVSGRYDQKDLVSLIEKNRIDIIFIPSVWPETFSYTTEEAIQTGLPVAVFNLGAPAERVKVYDNGLIVSEINAINALDEIISFMRDRKPR